MSRPNVIYTSEHPYHVSARSNNRDWFDVPMPYLYGVYSNVLEDCVNKYGIEVHAFVLMNNHFHLIASTPKKNIGEALRYFMTQTSKGISKKSDRINHIYGGRNYKSILSDPEDYAICLRYVYRNPVKANICGRVQDYSWSTANKRPQKLKELIVDPPFGHSSLLPVQYSERLEWFNQPPSDGLDDLIRKAMKRARFEIKTNQRTKKKFDRAGELILQRNTKK